MTKVFNFKTYKIVFKCSVMPQWEVLIIELIRNWKEVIFYKYPILQINNFHIKKANIYFVIDFKKDSKLYETINDIYSE